MRKKNRLLASPYLVWMIIFIVLPILLIVYYSLTVIDTSGNTFFSLYNFERFFQPIYLKVLWKSIVVALKSVFLCFIIGYPVAFILSRKDFSHGGTILFLLIAPMWMNFLLRTFGWLTLLERNGIINNILSFLGFQRINFLYTDGAVLLGMVYNYLPFMILPIHTVLVKMDNSILEAAQDLGANPFKVFLKIIFPLSIPGVISGFTMVFMPAVTTFIVSNILGGGQYMLIGNLIQQQFLVTTDWNFGSAISVILMIIILFTMKIFDFIDSDANTGGTIL